jgi:hypothetical protein
VLSGSGRFPLVPKGEAKITASSSSGSEVVSRVWKLSSSSAPGMILWTVVLTKTFADEIEMTRSIRRVTSPDNPSVRDTQGKQHV